MIRQDELRPNPMKKANLLSYLTFWWMNDLFKLGNKKDLDSLDLYKLLDSDTSTAVCDRLERQWNQEVQRGENSGKRPSLMKAAFMTYMYQWLSYGVLELLKETLAVLNPLWVAGIISYFEGGSTLTEAYFYATAITLTAVLFFILNHWASFKLYCLGWQLRVATCALMYKKTLRLSGKSLASTPTGQILNLGATDVIRFDLLFHFTHYLWLAPLQAVVAIYLLWREIGASSFVGLAIIFIGMVSQILMGQLFGKIRAKTAVQTDKRIRMMNELLVAMKIVKLYAWEKPFASLISSVRRQEIKQFIFSSFIKAYNYAMTWASSRLVIFAVLVVYVKLGGQLLPSRVFYTLALINAFRIPLGVFLPQGVEKLAESRISFNRIQEFLVLDEINTSDKTSEDMKVDSKTKSSEECGFITFQNFTASYEDDNLAFVEDQETATAKRNIVLDGIDLKFQQGQLIAVIGPVGAGKSSLLSAILGELPAKLGRIESRGRMVYAGQVPWVFSGSVRENILFGEEFDAERFDRVVKACALTKDLKFLKNGPETLVGERGVILSGGQKARVNLARAAYRRNSAIVLMDDPLSAVDAAVANHLFTESICGLLKEKTRILVTHQLQYLKDADKIVILKEGKVVGFGSFAELQADGADFASLLKHVDQDQAKLNTGKQLHEPGKMDFRNNVEKQCGMKADYVPEVAHEETKAQGSIELKCYMKYLASDKLGFSALLIIMLINQSLYVICDWWISVWAEESASFYANASTHSLNNFSEIVTLPSFATEPSGLKFDNDYYILIFLYLTLTFITAMFVRAFYQNRHLVVSGRRMHDKMLSAILKVSIRFFDVNPTGRILNRFSKDMGQIDELLPWMYLDFSFTSFLVISVVILCAVISYFVLIVVIPLVIFFVWLRHYYVKTSRDIKRIEGSNRSPVFSHLTSTLHGMTTVRAFRMQGEFEERFHVYQDLHSSAWFLFLSGTRWFSFGLEVISVIFIGSVSFLPLITSSLVEINAGSMGLILIYSLQLMAIFQWCIRLSTEVENHMTSVERIQQYSKLPPEAPHVVPGTDPGPGWPSRGSIMFQDVSFAHYNGGPDVLKQISFELIPGEKIGIVGRTGAGKSSLIASLFRLNEHIGGKVFLDDVDISTIGLTKLRSSMSVIPQDPVLFAGSLRTNLDLFSIYTDEEIWDALHKVEMKQFAESFPSKLEIELSEAGSNLSVGQRQLICLARAVLRRNKVLVIDEATANVDLITDALIQKTIRETFRDCTVLTVAHRIETIIDCDRVMVLSDGRVDELDSPHNLLSNKNGTFNKMVNSVGAASSKEIRKRAKKVTWI